MACQHVIIMKMGVRNLVGILIVTWLAVGTRLMVPDNITLNKGDNNKSGWWQKNSRIVYDVSDVIRKNHTTDLHKLLNTSNSESPDSFLFYYEVQGNISNYPCSWITGDGRQDVVSCGKFGINGVSIILNEKANPEAVLALSTAPMYNYSIGNLLKTNDSFIDSVIISVDSPVESCNSTSRNAKNLFDNIHIDDVISSVKVGLQYEQHFSECCGRLDQNSVGFLDNIIFTVEVTPQTTRLSYSVFSDMMDKTVQNFRQCMQQNSFNGTIYIRLVIKNWGASIAYKHYHRYEALILRYLHSWTKADNGSEKFIVRPPLEPVHAPSNRHYLKERVMGVNLKYEKPHFKFRQDKDIPNWNCEPPSLKKIMYSLYDEILFMNPLFRAFDISDGDDCQFENEEGQSNHAAFREGYSSFLLYDDIDNLNLRDLTQLRHLIESNEMHKEDEKTVTPNLRSVCLEGYDFSSGESNVNITDVAKLSRFLQIRNISFGCIFKANATLLLETPFQKSVQKQCGPIFTESTEIVILLSVDLSVSQDLLQFLRKFHQRWQEFEAVYVNKRVVPFFVQELENPQDMSLFYCSSEIQKNNDDCQTILSFANVHEWTKLVLLPNVVFSSNFLSADLLGFWQTVETDSTVDQTATKFPVFYRTNVNDPIDDKLPYTYPCIKWTQNATKRIKFLKNPKMGTTFEAALRTNTPLSRRELQTVLAFALERFSSVEIIVNGKEEFNQIETVLLTDFVGDIKRSRKDDRMNHTIIFVEVPITRFKSLRRNIANLGDNGDIAVHISGWECEKTNKWKSNRTLSLNFGLTVQDCGYEMNLKLARLKKLPFIHFVSYIVCNVKPVVPNNLNQKWMQFYMGTLFYTKVYMEKFLPPRLNLNDRVRVMFRINLNSATKRCPDKNDTDGVLRFFRDLNQHSKIYKMKYFIVRAFETEEVADECPYSWWRIEDYKDLTNTSVFVDRELEYFGLNTTLEIEIPPEDEVNESGGDIPYLRYIINVSIISILFLVIIVLWVKLRRSRKQFLTQKEINDFYNGTQAIGDGVEMTSATCYDPMYAKFKDNFEIPEKDIEIAELIGTGQFGVVHRGLLCKRVKVAIKTPRSDCGVEQFKSTLSELKMHCYIGAHQNIVSLLGAYTKEIISGKLYIVLEYCELGSLLNHLRNCQNSEVDGENASTVELTQLCGFAHQIACGMEYLAEKRVIHGDLATRNVLLTSDHTCKIADFGLSRRLYELSEYHKTSREPLPWRWMAIESLKNLEFTTKSDVWSYGVTLWEIFSLGLVPYTGRSWTDDFVSELENGMRMTKAEYASEEIHEKTLMCWNGAPETRPDFNELIEFFVCIRNREYIDMT